MNKPAGSKEWSQLQIRHLAVKAGHKLAAGRKVEILRVERLKQESAVFRRVLAVGIFFLASAVALDFSRKDQSLIRHILKEEPEGSLSKIRFHSLQRVEKLSQTPEGLPLGSRRSSGPIKTNGLSE